MRFTSCSSSIESNLKSVSGVKRANISLATEEAVVEYDSKVINYKQIMERINNMQYGTDLISAGEERDKVTLQVEGVHSIEATNLIRSSLENIPGVKAVEIDIEGEKVVITYDTFIVFNPCFQSMQM